MTEIVQINSDYADVPQAIEGFEAFMGAQAMNDKTQIHLALALMEVLNNIIEHGLKGQTGHKIEITWSITKNTLNIHITDPSDTHSLTQLFQQSEFPNPKDLPENGWGLSIIKQVFDKVKFSRENDLNTTTLLKRI